MATDMHSIIEIKENNEWHAALVPNMWHGTVLGREFSSDNGNEPLTHWFNIDRDYNLFAILGDVCNDEHELVSLSSGRGIPEDASKVVAAALDDNGDLHSWTWVMLPEILQFDWTRTFAQETYQLTATEFIEFEGMKPFSYVPKSWSNPSENAVVMSVTDMRSYVAGMLGDDWSAASDKSKLDNLKCCEIEVRETYAEAAQQLWITPRHTPGLLPTMLKLGKEYGYENVRVVIAFDN